MKNRIDLNFQKQNNIIDKTANIILRVNGREFTKTVSNSLTEQETRKIEYELLNESLSEDLTPIEKSFISKLIYSQYEEQTKVG